MAKGNKKARAVQKVIGCRYMAALRFVKSPIWSKEAESYAREHGVSKREAFVAIAPRYFTGPHAYL
ncbi:MAG: hypothetical protein MI923_25735 [Phycisphaerales bacterium]|nr:hypothetical protein [Phycisphaerales bacterium]